MLAKLAQIASAKQLANKHTFVNQLYVSSLPLPVQHLITDISVPICAGPPSIVINFQSSLGVTTSPAERCNPSHHAHQDDCERNLEPQRATNPSQGAVRNVVGIRCGAISGNMKVSFQAARSIG